MHRWNRQHIFYKVVKDDKTVFFFLVTNKFDSQMQQLCSGTLRRKIFNAWVSAMGNRPTKLLYHGI